MSTIRNVTPVTGLTLTMVIEYLRAQGALSQFLYENETMAVQLWRECVRVIMALQEDCIIAPRNIEYGTEACEYEDEQYTMSAITLQWPEIEVLIAYHDCERITDRIGCNVYVLENDDFTEIMEIDTTDEAIDFIEQYVDNETNQFSAAAYLANRK